MGHPDRRCLRLRQAAIGGTGKPNGLARQPFRHANTPAVVAGLLAAQHQRHQRSSCSFSNPVSHRDLLTCDDASRLTRCHRAFVSNSCHFFGTPLPIPWRHIQSLRDADQTRRKVPSRDGALSQPQPTYGPASAGAAQCIWHCRRHHRPWIVSIIHEFSLSGCITDDFASAPTPITSAEAGWPTSATSLGRLRGRATGATYADD